MQATDNFRLGDEYRAKLGRIADEKKWTRVQVMRSALDALGTQIFGRRWEADPDTTPIKKRTEKG